MQELDEAKAWRALILSTLGTCMLMFSIIWNLGFLQLFMFGVGFLLVGIGLSDLGFAVGMKQAFQKWRKSRAGLGWQLAVFAAGVIAMPVAWFIASWPADEVYTMIAGIYTFTGVTATAITFARGLIGLLVGVGLFFLVIWLWVNVNKREAY